MFINLWRLDSAGSFKQVKICIIYYIYIYYNHTTSSKLPTISPKYDLKTKRSNNNEIQK